jgi:hypothetical protein
MPMATTSVALVGHERPTSVYARTSEEELAYYRRLGFTGSATVAVGGLLAGVIPASAPVLDLPIIREARESTVLPLFVVYVGLATLLLAWWCVGGLVRRPDAPSWRPLASTAAWWAAPFALVTPVFSGDVYSYLAQGAMTMEGIDAYRVGPAALGASPLAANVPEIWRYTPAPYGPVFLDVAGAVTKVTGEGVWVGILGMRLMAVLSVGLLVWSIPRLARHCGVDPAAATWLGILNPLVLLHLAGDAHNDALMLGLMCMGFLLVLERRPVLGTVVVTLAVMVKAPAGLALPFLVPVWAAQLTGRNRTVRAGVRIAAVAGGTTAVVTLLAGTGPGWLRTLDTPTRARTWMSITTDLGYVVGSLAHRVSGVSVDQVRHSFWLIGLVVAAATAAVLWRHQSRLGPLTALGLSLSALVLAGPVVHPWYLLWGIVPLAAAAGAAAIRRVVALGSALLVLLVIPGGVQPGLPVLAGALQGSAAVLLVAFACGGVDRGRLRAVLGTDRCLPAGHPPVRQTLN